MDVNEHVHLWQGDLSVLLYSMSRFCWFWIWKITRCFFLQTEGLGSDLTSLCTGTFPPAGYNRLDLCRCISKYFFTGKVARLWPYMFSCCRIILNNAQFKYYFYHLCNSRKRMAFESKKITLLESISSNL